MGKKATTIEEQILLLQSRGMVLDFEKAKVREILMDIGYYRLGFYWHPFEIDDEHTFKSGTLFSDAVALYYLDFELRSLFNKYLNRIEINFKTKVIYEVCNHFIGKPTWFADHAVMKKPFIEKLPQVYDFKFKKNNKAIKNHHSKYINHKYAPAWKTLEFLPFGSILYLFKNIKDSAVKNIISNHFGLRNHHNFESHVSILILIRNLCAHGGQLYDLNLPKGIVSVFGLKFEGKERTNLRGTARLVEYYLEKVSINRAVEFRKKFETLLQEHNRNENLKDILSQNIGLQ